MKAKIMYHIYIYFSHSTLFFYGGLFDETSRSLRFLNNSSFKNNKITGQYGQEEDWSRHRHRHHCGRRIVPIWKRRNEREDPTGNGTGVPQFDNEHRDSHRYR